MCTVTEFLKRSTEAAKLVYTKDVGMINALKLHGKDNNLKSRVNLTEMVALRSLTKDDLIIVTEPALLRGFDYKSDAPAGINLLMMSSVSSKGALL